MKNLLSSLLLLLAMPSIAQVSDTIYLDARFQPETKSESAYFRVFVKVQADPEVFAVRTFYKNGQLYESGASASGVVLAFEGTVRHYWPNGKPKDEATYIKGRKTGLYQGWYDNGMPSVKGSYEKIDKTDALQTELLIDEHWDRNGNQTVTKGSGYYSYKDTDAFDEGALKNRRRVGNWKGEDFRLKLKYEDSYDYDGTFKTGKSVDKNGETHTYDAPEKLPDYPGGMKAFYQFVAKNFRTPEETVSGRMILYFVISEEGEVGNLKVLRSLSPACDI